MGETRTRAAVDVIGLCAVAMFCVSWSGNELVRWTTVALTAAGVVLTWFHRRAAALPFVAALLVSAYTVWTPNISANLAERVLGIGVHGPLQQAGWLLLVPLVWFSVGSVTAPTWLVAVTLVAALLAGWGWSAFLEDSTDGSHLKHTTATRKPSGPADGKPLEVAWARTLPPEVYSGGVVVPGRGVVVEVRDRSGKGEQGLYVGDAATGETLWQYSVDEHLVMQVMIDSDAGLVFAQFRRAALVFDLMTGDLRDRLDLYELQPESTFSFVRAPGENQPSIRFGSVALVNASRPGVVDDAVYAVDARTLKWQEVLRGGNPDCADYWVRGAGAENYFVRNACPDASVEVIRLDGLREASRTRTPVRPDDRRCRAAPCRLIDIVGHDHGLLLLTSDSGGESTRGQENHGLVWLREDGSVGARVELGNYGRLIPLREKDNSRSRVVAAGEGIGTKALDFGGGALTQTDVAFDSGAVSLGTASGVVYQRIEQNMVRALDVRSFTPLGDAARPGCPPRYVTAADGRVLITCQASGNGDSALVALHGP
ncbi:hypothetical protein [Allokutzneria oryzae]|uniref:PQQ-binding-like beta-propeller repeat protein n=1 Tax=Allokutzneria oryzae TaxID=1378989 RepID=A0ABV6A0P2_9PSEU